MDNGMVKVRQYRLKNRETGVVFGFNALMSREPQMILIEVELEVSEADAVRYNETRERQDKELADMSAADEPPMTNQAALVEAIEARVRAELEKKFAAVQFQPESLQHPEPDLPEPPCLEPELHGPPNPSRRKGKGLNTDLTSE